MPTFIRLAPLCALAALSLAAAPRLASAEPATVKLFEAPVRASPARDAAVIHTFAEKAELSVSEAGEGGFRRVRLPDGSVGWIEERALAFPGRPASLAVSAAPPAASPAAAPAPDLRAHIYVKDLGHLADLVKEDGEIKASADRLVARRNATYVIMVAGLAAATALVASGASQFGDLESHRGERLFTAGLVTAGGSLLVGLLVHPRRGEVLDLLNGWNVRHPDRQFEISAGSLHQ
jgi:SH3 domain-containing protein